VNILGLDSALQSLPVAPDASSFPKTPASSGRSL
jgi:hypothetical protein